MLHRISLYLEGSSGSLQFLCLSWISAVKKTNSPDWANRTTWLIDGEQPLCREQLREAASVCSSGSGSTRFSSGRFEAAGKDGTKRWDGRRNTDNTDINQCRTEWQMCPYTKYITGSLTVKSVGHQIPVRLPRLHREVRGQRAAEDTHTHTQITQ